MAWATTEENTLLRARQLRRFYAKHISSEGPLKYADKITPTDMDLATTLAPEYSLKLCAEGEQEYPEQWELKPKSLSFVLSNFRPKAKEMKIAMDEEIDAFLAGESTTRPPVFLGGYGDRLHILTLDKTTKALQRELKKAREKADQYLARAEKAEAELQELLEELEEESEEDEEDKEDDGDDEDRKRKRKRRKID